MKYIAICIKGLEDIAITELKELGIIANKIYDGRLEFKAKSVKSVIEKSQSLVKVYEKYGELKFKTLEDIQEYVEKLNLEIDKPFKMACHREGDHVFNSQTVERELGMLVDGEHDLKDPEKILFIDILDDQFYFGLDLAPKLLSKREYRIKVCNQSINACIAYSMVRLSDYGGNVLLDPFCKDGIISIEAARYKKGKINCFDELFHNIRSAEVNSKLAKVNKEINFARIDTDWLDGKFEEGTVDCIVSVIPFPSKHVIEKKVKRIYEVLLERVHFILNEKGKVVFIGQNMSLLKEMLNNFKILEERIVRTGGLEQEIVVFTK